MCNSCIFLLFSLPIADAIALERGREKGGEEKGMKAVCRYLFISADVTVAIQKRRK